MILWLLIGLCLLVIGGILFVAGRRVEGVVLLILGLIPLLYSLLKIGGFVP